MIPTLTLAFAVLLMVGVLISERASRTVLSTAVMFLLGGFVLGPGVLGVVPITPGDPVVGVLAQLALFSVLYTDGMKVGLSDLRRAWRLPGRALLLGLPLTLAITALLAYYIVGLPWLPCLLLGAVLAPTDPVFAAAIVGRKEVRFGYAICSTSSQGSMTGWPFPWFSCCWPSAAAQMSGSGFWPKKSLWACLSVCWSR